MTHPEGNPLHSKPTRFFLCLQCHLQSLADLRQLINGVTGSNQHPYPIDGQKLGNITTKDCDASFDSSRSQASSPDSGVNILLLLQVTNVSSGSMVLHVSHICHSKIGPYLTCYTRIWQFMSCFHSASLRAADNTETGHLCSIAACHN